MIAVAHYQLYRNKALSLLVQNWQTVQKQVLCVDPHFSSLIENIELE